MTRLVRRRPGAAPVVPSTTTGTALQLPSRAPQYLDVDTFTAAKTQVSGLMLTGERTLPGIWHENYWFRRHEAAYLALAPFVVGASVLEAGAGEGYGAATLATSARTVVAVELDVGAAHHASRTYPAVSVVRGDLQRLPIGTGSIEVVASLQTIEHLADQEAFVAECARVLRPSGTLLVTTPNAVTFPRGNPFHTRELTSDELVDLLGPQFEVVRLWGVRHGRRLRRQEVRTGSLVDAQIGEPADSWGETLAARVRDVRADDFEVGPLRQSDLDLVAVAVRR